METMIFNPLEDYEKRLKESHKQNILQRLDELTQQSGINVEENRATVKEYDAQKAKADHLGRRATRLKVLRVFLIIGAVLAGIGSIWGFLSAPAVGAGCLAAVALMLVPLFWKLNPAIRNLSKLFEEESAKAQALYQKAMDQVAPLNRLFTDQDALSLVEKTIPTLDFAPHFSFSQEKDMRQNFDFAPADDDQSSVLDALSGTLCGNPFLFEQRLVHEMGTETYHGTKTIRWTEFYTDSKGKRRTRSRSQTLHASVTKPKPFYHKETKLYFGAQGAPDLVFSRLNLHHEDKTERQLKATIRKGEKKLQEKEEDALKNNTSFTGMANSEFEVLFGATDRNHEVQFRLLFTPLAQTNMVDLLLSETGYGDDFDFFKNRRMNTIVTEHSQSGNLRLLPDGYHSHSYDIICEKFRQTNEEYFRRVYFDFAPLLAIPVYQEEPVHSMAPLAPYEPKYSCMEYESLANAMPASSLIHQDSKTEAILKASRSKENQGDSFNITAFSYDALSRTDYKMVLGGDGRMHSVAVHWKQYIPLTKESSLLIRDKAENTSSAGKHGLYAYTTIL